MSPRPLTPRQREVLDHLAAELLVLQRLPTVRELSAWLGAASANAGADYFRILRERGYLERFDGREGRTLRIAYLSDGRLAELAFNPPRPTTEDPAP